MSVLSGIEPAKVFEYFEAICGIPHGSGNTSAISEYLVDFAIDHGLYFIQEDNNNVVIYKDGCLGGENSETVILQGHMDMVCEKLSDCDIDFTKDGLRLILKDGVISADGTTLGGDDGIAVAYMLAILDSENIAHPPLECVFTVDEEIGLLGAAALNMKLLTGRKLLNIDSEEEGHIIVSCAGGALVEMHYPFIRRGAQGTKYKLQIKGLTGGHSGSEIDKGRANADILMAQMLKTLFYADDSLRIIALEGGFKDNAIPVAAESYFVSRNEDILREQLSELTDKFKDEFKSTDPNMDIELTKIENDTDIPEKISRLYPLDEMNNLNLIMLLGSLPNGIKKMSPHMEGLVQTSLNLGIMNTEENEMVFSYCVRSSVSKEKEEMIAEMDELIKSVGGSIAVFGDYPAWEYKEDSQLRKIMSESYTELFQKELCFEAMHAGVECGVFAGGLPGLDAVSFGPDIFDIHTPQERMPVDSVKRTWDFIVNILGRLI